MTQAKALHVTNNDIGTGIGLVETVRKLRDFDSQLDREEVTGADWDENIFDRISLRDVLRRARQSHPGAMWRFDQLPRFKFGPCPPELLGKFYIPAIYVKQEADDIFYGQVCKSDSTTLTGKGIRVIN